MNLMPIIACEERGVSHVVMALVLRRVVEAEAHPTSVPGSIEHVIEGEEGGYVPRLRAALLGLELGWICTMVWIEGSRRRTLLRLNDHGHRALEALGKVVAGQKEKG